MRLSATAVAAGLSVVLGFAGGVPLLGAQSDATTTPASAPSSAPVGAVALTATITSIAGQVQVRAAENQPWQKATVGMQLDQGAEIRTGLRSAVQFRIEPDQTITLDRLGTLKVLQAVLNKNKVTTDLGVKYGRTEYDIKAADLEHQSTIRSPGSTLAIRGTDVLYEDQVPWVPSAVSLTGRAQFRDFHRQLVPFGGKKKAAIAADKTGAAPQAVAKTKLDPHGAFAGRSEDENDLLVNLASAGGIDAQGLAAVQSLAKLGGFKGAFSGVPPVPGPLQVFLDWIPAVAGTVGAANLDLLVTDPQGQTVSAKNPVIGSGSAKGMHSGDDPGLNGSGEELVTWALFFPPGKYKVQAIDRSGINAQFFIQILQGQSAVPIKTFGIDPQPPLTLSAGQSFSSTFTTQTLPPANAGAVASSLASPAAHLASPTRSVQNTQGLRAVGR